MEARQRIIEAAKTGDAPAVAALLEKDPSASQAEEGGVPAVLLALYHGHPAIAELLALHKPRLDVHELAALGRDDVLRALLAHVPEDVRRPSADGHWPLGLAAFFGREVAVRVLLDAGADPNAASQNAMRVAPLHAAVAKRSLAVVRLLLDRGAQANARQAKGFTPLHGAAAGGDRAIVELLIARGADDSARSDDGESAADVARSRGHAALADWLAELGGLSEG